MEKQNQGMTAALGKDNRQPEKHRGYKHTRTNESQVERLTQVKHIRVGQLAQKEGNLTGHG